MKVETRTTTRETATVESLTFDVTIYELRVSAFCDVCPNEASGTKESLEKQGWFLGESAQFCPECNF